MNLFRTSLLALNKAVASAVEPKDTPLLSVDLSVNYRNKPGVLSDVQFTVAAGEIFGLVGESGSGKSTIALAILRLLETQGGSIKGSIRFEGRDLLTCSERELREIRGRGIAFIPQSPLSALNPALRLEAHFREAWKAHSRWPWSTARGQVRELLRQMGLPDDGTFLERYPHQISVGQAQRALIAMALLHRPALLIADEPTSALDANSQQGIIDLLARLNREFAMAVLYISHDLPSVVALSRRVGVLYGGRMVLTGPAEAILNTTLPDTAPTRDREAVLVPAARAPQPRRRHRHARR